MIEYLWDLSEWIEATFHRNCVYTFQKLVFMGENYMPVERYGMR
jgi:hypothetical protein